MHKIIKFYRFIMISTLGLLLLSGCMFNETRHDIYRDNYFGITADNEVIIAPFADNKGMFTINENAEINDIVAENEYIRLGVSNRGIIGCYKVDNSIKIGEMKLDNDEIVMYNKLDIRVNEILGNHSSVNCEAGYGNNLSFESYDKEVSLFVVREKIETTGERNYYMLAYNIANDLILWEKLFISSYPKNIINTDDYVFVQQQDSVGLKFTKINKISGISEDLGYKDVHINTTNSVIGNTIISSEVTEEELRMYKYNLQLEIINSSSFSMNEVLKVGTDYFQSDFGNIFRQFYHGVYENNIYLFSYSKNSSEISILNIDFEVLDKKEFDVSCTNMRMLKSNGDILCNKFEVDKNIRTSKEYMTYNFLNLESGSVVSTERQFINEYNNDYTIKV